MNVESEVLLNYFGITLNHRERSDHFVLYALNDQQVYDS